MTTLSISLVVTINKVLLTSLELNGYLLVTCDFSEAEVKHGVINPRDTFWFSRFTQCFWRIIIICFNINLPQISIA